MSLDSALMTVLADPTDKGPLVWLSDEGALYNPRLRHRYPVRSGIPVLLAGEGIPVDEHDHVRFASLSHLITAGEPLARCEERRAESAIAASPMPPAPGDSARYEGLASWYDELMRDPAGRGPLAESAYALLARLVGRGAGIALDVGCGTGIAAPALRELGYVPVGVDLAADQVRLAIARLPAAQGNAADLPIATGTVPLAYSTFTSTDWDDLATSLREIHRVLRPGGRYVDVGVHPCFYGSFAETRADGAVLQLPGYRTIAFRPPAHFASGVRSRVGAWHRPIGEIIQGIVDAGFRIVCVAEGGPAPLPAVLGISAVRE